MKRARSMSKRVARFLLAILIGAYGVAQAQGELRMPVESDCIPVEPDSVQISWDSPCDTGAWLFEPNVGCRMWDWHPSPLDVATWTGLCRNGERVGWGVMQWYEHGQPIDRFEGKFIAGKRQGAGRYTWDHSNWYVGLYEDDLPNGLGTASIGGQTFSGQWQHGCFARGTKVVAIGTPRRLCGSAIYSSMESTK